MATLVAALMTVLAAAPTDQRKSDPRIADAGDQHLLTAEQRDQHLALLQH